MITIFVEITFINTSKLYNRDNKRLRSTFWYAVFEKWISENFPGRFYDDFIYIDQIFDPTKNLKLIGNTWDWLLSHFGFTNPFRQREG